MKKATLRIVQIVWYHMRGCFGMIDKAIFNSLSGDEKGKLELKEAKRKRQAQGRTKAVSWSRASGDKKGVVKEARKLRRKR